MLFDGDRRPTKWNSANGGSYEPGEMRVGRRDREQCRCRHHLIVLIFEVRENTNAILAGNRQSIAERTGEFALAVAGSPELAAIQAQLMGSDTETQQARSYMVATLQLVQESYFLNRDGLLDEVIWRTRANLLDRVMIAGTTRLDPASRWDSAIGCRAPPAGHERAGMETPRLEG